MLTDDRRKGKPFPFSTLISTFFLFLEQGASIFHFAMGPQNYLAGHNAQ